MVDFTDPETDPEKILPIVRNWCIGKLKQKYPEASDDFISDAATHGTLKLWNKFQHDELPKAPFGFVLKCADRYLWKLLNAPQLVTSEFPIDDFDVPDDLHSPMEPVLNEGRRERQSRALSETLREFVKDCEQRGMIGLRVKECLERRFMGGDFDEIAAAMRQYADSTNPKNLVEVDLGRGGKALVKLRKPHDVNLTLFTAEPIKKRKSPTVDESEETSASVATKPGSSRPEDGSPRFPVLNRDHNAGDNPPISDAALADAMLLLKRLPEAQSSKILFIWLVRDTRAYCPSADRLDAAKQWCLQHFQTTGRQPTRAECPIEFLDIWYHVLERKCLYCAAAVASGFH